MHGNLNITGIEANSLLILSVEGARIGSGVFRSRRRFAARSRRMLPNYSIPLRPSEAAGLANPLFCTERSEATISQGVVPAIRENAWAVLDSMMGTVEGPTDWSSELDHYLYGTPKRNEQPQ